MNPRTLRLIVLSLLLPASSALLAQTPKPKSPFAIADKNGDGKVIEAEFVEAVKAKFPVDVAKKRFAGADKNRDKVLTQEEFIVATAEAADKARADAAAGNKTPPPGAGESTGTESKPKRTPKEDSR